MGGTLESYQSKIAGVLLNTYGKPNREGRRSPGMNPETLLTKRTVNLYMQDQRKNHQQHWQYQLRKHFEGDKLQPLSALQQNDMHMELGKRHTWGSSWVQAGQNPFLHVLFCMEFVKLEETLRVFFLETSFNLLLLETSLRQK